MMWLRKTRNTYLISPIPNGDTNALGHSLTSPNYALVIFLLLLELSIGGRGVHPDIKLSKCDLNTKRSELFNVLLDG